MLTAALLLLVALPGLVLVRSGSALARLLALIAMLAFALAALDPAAVHTQAVPARIAAVATAPGELAATAQRQLQQAVARAPGAELHVAVPAAADLQAQWLAALLHGGVRAAERLVVWTGDSPPLPGGDSATVLTAAPPLPFEPTALVLQPKGPLQAGRPAALELSCRELPAPATAQVRVTSADGAVLVSAEVQLQRDHTAVVEFVPPRAGRAEVAVELPIGDAMLRRRGELEIGPASPVLVVEDAAVVSAALQAQGVAVVSSRRVPADLGGYAAVVLLLPQFPVVQQRLVQALDDGLGLFIGGPALPQPGEPLAAVMPVQRTPQSPSATANGPGTGTGSGDSNGEPGQPASAVPQLPAEPGRTRPGDEPPPKPETAPPKGDLSGIQGQPGKLVETERRNIAVVLVVDRSGSMGLEVQRGRNRMSYAKTSALRTAEALLEGDEVGIVSFGSQGRARVELPMTPATDTERIAAGVARLRHAENEETWLQSGLTRALELLQPGKFAVKHVVVITDGAFYAEEYTALRGEAHRLKTQGVTVSIVQVGGQGIDALPGYDPADIARDGGGRYLPVSDATKVPVFVSLEVTQSLASVGRKPRGEGGDRSSDTPPQPPPPQPPPPEPRPPQPEPPLPEPEPEPPPTAAAMLTVRAVAESPLLQPRPQPAWPSLADAIACTGTVDAHVLLVVGRGGTPLLAFANRGLGRIAAFAADLGGAACEHFRRDADFPARLSQWVAALAPPTRQPAAADLLRTVEVQPPRPTPRALQQLALGSLTPPQPVADYAPPPPRTRFLARGLAPEWALYALLALLLLACGEWALSRRVPR